MFSEGTCQFMAHSAIDLSHSQLRKGFTMRAILLIASMVLGSVAMAKPSADQIEKAKDLPTTVVVRQSKSDPSKIEVVHLKEHLPKGKILSNLKFEKAAMNSEAHGIAFDSGNELDKTSSTSSWRFGWGGYGMGGWGGGMGYGYGMGYGWGRPYYGMGMGWAYPYYNYAGYGYGYYPYWGYSDMYWNYAYCGWGYGGGMYW